MLRREFIEHNFAAAVSHAFPKILVGQQLAYQTYYFFGLGCAAGLFVYQQILISAREREKCLAAFANNVWVGFAVFAGVVLEVHLVVLSAPWAAL